jgi:hypothetical protein
MSTDEFVAWLHKLRFFEGYSQEAARLAEERIRKQHDDGIQGPGRKYFERFPGFALSFLAIPGEWDGEPYEPLVGIVADNSFGMFNPTEVTDERHRDDVGTATLSFTVNGVRYRATADGSSGWVPPEFLELIEEAFTRHCGGLRFHETFACAAPGGGDETTRTICTPRAYKGLLKANLLPEEPGQV